MPRHVVLLRGINLVRRNRVSMPELRRALGQAGYGDVKTHLQSGNILLSSRASPERVARDVRSLIKQEFDLDIAVLVRSQAELLAILRRNPLKKVATNPRRYLVTFLSVSLPRGNVDELRRVAKHELFAIAGREVYSWHPDGIGRTPLWERLASKSLGVQATSRNWATVTTLATMAAESTSR